MYPTSNLSVARSSPTLNALPQKPDAQAKNVWLLILRLRVRLLSFFSGTFLAIRHEDATESLPGGFGKSRQISPIFQQMSFRSVQPFDSHVGL